MVSAIIVAAGNGSRMGKPKQLLKICGIPIIARSMMLMQNTDIIDEIIVVARKDNISEIERLSKNHNITKLSHICEGGMTRLDSVSIGVKASAGDYYCIHDGARPLTTSHAVTEVVKKAIETGAAALGYSITDTIKRVDKNNKILVNVAREELIAVETPQVISAKIYDKAIENALTNKLLVTDDCSVCEAYGVDVYIVKGGKDNIKITLPEDITIAEAVLKNRR